MSTLNLSLSSAVVALLGLLSLNTVGAAPEPQRLQVDHDKVRRWNEFVVHLETLHRRRLEDRRVETTERRGGYPMTVGADFYREVSYTDAESGQLLSRIQWETETPDTIHAIEVFIYDLDGRLVRDYLAAFLPVYRNAPVQTFVNFHAYNGALHAFRQFDASGVRIHEQCRRAADDEILLAISEDELLGPDARAITSDELYQRCFAGLPTEAGSFLNPLAELQHSDLRISLLTGQWPSERGAIEAIAATADARLASVPRDAAALVQRGNARFLLHDFPAAIADFTAALDINDGMDEAYFGRGMARGRLGELKAGIADLSVYLERHPNSSVGFTKRGVRHIWNGDLSSAERDLRRALELNPTNAEAHDDLGVVLAQRQQYAKALTHFDAAVAHDPLYQKAHHNAAMVLHITSQNEPALMRVDRALMLAPGDRDAMLLKAQILEGLGREEEAQQLAREAEFLPEAHWSERLEVQ